MDEESARMAERAKAHYQEWLWSQPDLDFAGIMAGFAAAEIRRLDSLRARAEPRGFGLSLQKGLCAAAICRDSTDGTSQSVRAALFLAEAWHMKAHGRPIFGDRWSKEASGPRPFALREATGSRQIESLRTPVDRDLFSRSDEDQIGSACAAVSAGQAPSAIAAIACWSAAAEGTYVPLAAILLESPGGDAALTHALENAAYAVY